MDTETKPLKLKRLSPGHYRHLESGYGIEGIWCINAPLSRRRWYVTDPEGKFLTAGRGKLVWAKEELAAKLAKLED